MSPTKDLDIYLNFFSWSPDIGIWVIQNKLFCNFSESASSLGAYSPKSKKGCKKVLFRKFDVHKYTISFIGFITAEPLQGLVLGPFFFLIYLPYFCCQNIYKFSFGKLCKRRNFLNMIGVGSSSNNKIIVT